MELWNLILGAVMGALAGLIDAIAGGGGLITLPTLTLLVGPGAHAIGTNKIVGVTGACVALLVYARNHPIDWPKAIAFAAWVAVGSVSGSLATPLLPESVFPWLLLITCPLILWLVWSKELWVAREAPIAPSPSTLGPRRSLILNAWDARVASCGVICGFYDGAWGPGGGTFMFLGLLFVARLPLLMALAASKFANTCSAGSALVSYGLAGFVHWREGTAVAIGMALGSLVGATLATRRASRIVRPVLATVVLLLLVRLLQTHFGPL